MSFLRRLLLPLLLLHRGPEEVRRWLSPRNNERASLIRAAGKLGAAAGELLPQLLDGLSDDEWEVRQSTATALAQIGDPRALEALLEACGREQDEVVRVSLLEASVALAVGHPRGLAVVPLLERATEDPHWEVRLQAALSWGFLRGFEQEAYRALRGRLVLESDHQVRSALVQSLGRIKDARASGPLLQMLDEEIDVDLPLALDLLLAVGRLGQEEALPSLLLALHDVEPSVQARAALALGFVGQKLERAQHQLVPQLLDLAQRNPERAILVHVACALARFAPEQHLQVLGLHSWLLDALHYWRLRFLETDPDAFEDPFALRDGGILYPSSDERVLALEEWSACCRWLRLSSNTLPAELLDGVEDFSQEGEAWFLKLPLQHAQRELEGLRARLQEQILQRKRDLMEEALFD